MRILVDTNGYLTFAGGDEAATKRFQQMEHIFLPFVAVAELRAGFLGGSRRHENERILTRFLNMPRCGVLYADEATTHHYARLFLQLRKQGTPIPTNDIWIAALAVQHDLMLYSRDAHFDHLPQLARVD
jgi:tRNA(fMet)-specific endonuclease VapC